MINVQHQCLFVFGTRLTSLYTMMLILTPRSAAAFNIRSTRYCSHLAGGRRRYSSGESHPLKQSAFLDTLQTGTTYSRESRQTLWHSRGPLTLPTYSRMHRHTTWHRWLASRVRSSEIYWSTGHRDSLVHSAHPDGCGYGFLMGLTAWS